MKGLFVSAAALALLVTSAPAANRPSRLTLGEKRAACVAAFYYIFQDRCWHSDQVRRAREAGKRPLRLFLEAYDEKGREVTPDTLIDALRRQGFNAHPAWTERKWRRANDPKRLKGVHYHRLTQFKYLSAGRIQWHVQDRDLSPINSEFDGSLIQSIIELKKQSGRWIVVRYHVKLAAG